MDDPLDAWEYLLPSDRIARFPAAERHASRLMHVPLAGGATSDHVFADLPALLRPGDLLVANDTRVMAARLRARRASGGAVEVFLLGHGDGPVPALLRPARRLREGEVLALVGGGTVRVLGPTGDPGIVRVELDRPAEAVMAAQGEIPLPPYLERDALPEDRERYQTVYAGPIGAAAAPTAGLHFDATVFEALEARGIGWATVTLHVGIGTFRPLQPEELASGRLHAESYVVPEAFHLPRSSLLLLVGALVGRERLLAAYDDAVRRGYRFYSYGDAMLLV
jgi:S-adenosylmethionine:tRNA ribosyltransferase-isomerase